MENQITIESMLAAINGISSFLSIVIVIIRKSGALKIKDTIRLPLSCQTTDLIRNWKVLKDLKNQVSQMKSLLRAPKDLRCLQPVDIWCIGKRSTVLTGPSFVM